MWMGVWVICMLVYHVGALTEKARKRDLDPLKLELQTIVRHDVGVRN